MSEETISVTKLANKLRNDWHTITAQADTLETVDNHKKQLALGGKVAYITELLEWLG